MAEKKEEHQIPMELIKQALLEACLLDLEEILKADIPEPTLSRRYKIRMNRLFRQHVRDSSLPYPEVDNWYEKIRCRFIRNRPKPPFRRRRI